MISLDNLADKILLENSIAIFTHIRPDGDAIGSSLSLKLALQKLGKEADVFIDDIIPEKFKFLPSVLTIKNELTKEYSLFISVDAGDINRLGKFADAFSKHKKSINIDHHISNTNFAHENYVRDCAANCENMFELIEEMDVDFDTDIANALLLGIVTDTGNFRHNNVTPETFDKAGELVKSGASCNLIQYNTFFKQTQARAKLYGLVMSKIRYFLEDKLAIISIFKKDIEGTKSRQDETEGFIDFIMGIDTVEIGISILEVGENKFKISLRSKEAKNNVNEIASVFGGGGHIQASGCQIQGSYEEVVDKLVYAVKSHTNF